MNWNFILTLVIYLVFSVAVLFIAETADAALQKKMNETQRKLELLSQAQARLDDLAVEVR